MVRRGWPLLLVMACASVRPSPGSAAPEVALLDGPAAPWTSLLAGQPRTLVVFATVWCEVCRRERPEVEAWARAHQPRRTIYVFSGSAAGQVRALPLDRRDLTVVVDADGRLADRYAVQATPTLLVLDPAGRVLASSHRFAGLERP